MAQVAAMLESTVSGFVVALQQFGGAVSFVRDIDRMSANA
jgi:hypothetical protein